MTGCRVVVVDGVSLRMGLMAWDCCAIVSCAVNCRSVAGVLTLLLVTGVVVATSAEFEL